MVKHHAPLLVDKGDKYVMSKTKNKQGSANKIVRQIRNL